MKRCVLVLSFIYFSKIEQEEKFRSINLDNNAFKNRVATCIGGTALLKAVGFVKEESRLFMSMEVSQAVCLRWFSMSVCHVHGLRCYEASCSCRRPFVSLGSWYVEMATISSLRSEEEM